MAGMVLARWCNAVLASSPYSVDVTDLPNSVKNCVALNALIENLTDTPSRVVCGRPFHPTPTSIDDILDNCDVLFEQLAEFGAPLRKSVLCPGLLTGSPAPALEILWQILVKIGLGDDGLNALLVWCRDVHGCVVDNLSDAFYDGTALLKLFQSCFPQQFANVTLDSTDPVSPLFKLAESCGIPDILSESLETPSATPDIVFTSEGVTVDMRVVAYLSLVVRTVEQVRMQDAIAAQRTKQQSGGKPAGEQALIVLLTPNVSGESWPIGAPPRNLRLAVSMSNDGMFLMDRIKPHLSQLSHRLPSLIPLAGVDGVICSAFGVFANTSVNQPSMLGVSHLKFKSLAANCRVLQSSGLRIGNATPLSHNIYPQSPLFALLSQSTQLTGLAPGSATSPLAGNRLPSDVLESLFITSLLNQSEPNTEDRLVLNGFAACLELVAAKLFITEPSDASTALSGAVYRLVTQHLVPLVEECGARLRKRVERFMSQKRSDVRTMTSNRPQLSALFSSFSSAKPGTGGAQAFRARGKSASISSPPLEPASPVDVGKQGMKSPTLTSSGTKLSVPRQSSLSSKLGHVLGTLTTETIKSDSPKLLVTSPGGQTGMLVKGGVLSQQPAPLSPSAVLKEEQFKAARAAATSELMSRIPAPEQSPRHAVPTVDDKAQVVEGVRRGSLTGLVSPMSSPASAIARVLTQTFEEKDEPPTVPLADRSMTRTPKSVFGNTSPLVPGRQLRKVSPAHQGSPQSAGTSKAQSSPNIAARRNSFSGTAGLTLASPSPLSGQRGVRVDTGHGVVVTSPIDPSSAPRHRRMSTGTQGVSPLDRTRTLLLEARGDPDTLPAAVINDLRRQGFKVGASPQSLKSPPGSTKSSRLSPVFKSPPHTRSPFNSHSPLSRTKRTVIEPVETPDSQVKIPFADPPKRNSPVAAERRMLPSFGDDNSPMSTKSASNPPSVVTVSPNAIAVSTATVDRTLGNASPLRLEATIPEVPETGSNSFSITSPPAGFTSPPSLTSHLQHSVIRMRSASWESVQVGESLAGDQQRSLTPDRMAGTQVASHRMLERVRRMSRGETGAPVATTFSSPKAISPSHQQQQSSSQAQITPKEPTQLSPAMLSAVPPQGPSSPFNSHSSPLSRPASSRSSTPPILAPLDKQERVSPTPVSGPAHIAATVKPVPVPVTSQGTDVPAAAQAEPRQPPPPPPRPSRQSVTSDPSTPGALRVQRTSSIMSVSSGLGSPDIRPLEVIEDMTCPEGEIACVDLITCFHQCGIVPDVLSAEQLAALLTLACGDAKTISFGKFESLLMAVARFAKTGDHSVRSLLQLLNSSEPFQFVVATRPGVRRFEL